MGQEVNRFTLRAMGYSSVAVASFIVALVLSSELFLAASLISGTIVLLSLTMYPPRVRVERRLSKKSMFEGETLDVDIRLKGKGQLGNVEIFDKVSPLMEISEGSNLALLPPGSEGYSYIIKAPLRGFHRIGSTLIRRWDPLWIWFREGDAENKDRISVFPEISPGRAGEMLIKDTKQRPGDMRLKRVGMGKEFHSIRDYTTTDPFNTINWKATARRRKLLVNQFEAESVTDVMFILDSRLVSRVGRVSDNPAERSVRFCASMATELIRRSNRVGLVIYGSSISVMKPRSGSGALAQLLHKLTDTTSSGQITLGAAVAGSLRGGPPNCPVVLLSALNEDPTVIEAAKQLIGRGHRLTIISPSGLEFERQVYDGKVLPKYVLKRLGRDNLLQDLRSMGARVIDWDPENDVIWAMEEVWK
jgi:uncharacterized protein (DUF58 family)